MIIRVNKSFFRENEVDNLRGDARKAKEELGWQPQVNFNNLVAMMANADLGLVSRTAPQTQIV